MDDGKVESVRNICRDTMCLHLEREMIGHVLDQLATGAESIPVIGCDARTGVPTRLNLPESQLRDVPITT